MSTEWAAHISPSSVGEELVKVLFASLVVELVDAPVLVMGGDVNGRWWPCPVVGVAGADPYERVPGGET